MNDIESFVNKNLADADAQGVILDGAAPVMTLAAFAAGAAVCSAVVTAYEAGAGD